MDITQIILGILTLLGGLLTAFIIPLLKNKLNAQQLVTLNAIIKTGVFAAEQLFTEGSTKKAYVRGLLNTYGYSANEDLIDAKIEAMVRELKIETSKREN